jgi:peptidoglycan hydrolase-like protein with peptidoglycan-binding domain
MVFLVLLIFVVPPVISSAHSTPAWLTSPTCETSRDLLLTDPPLQGPDVEELQIRLGQLGFYHDEPTGVYDLATSRAVEEFQRFTGLEPDGVVTPDTWDYMAQGEEVAAESPTPPPPGEVEIVVDVSSLTLYIYYRGQVHSRYPVAVGRPGSMTPVGEFLVRNKGFQPGGPFGSRWLGLNIPWGTYGIHGTNNPASIGTMASSGCVRMHNKHVEEIYPWVKVGTRVTIVGREIRARLRRDLRKGSIGYDVQYAQLCMRQAGFDAGLLDGRFGEDMERAAKELQAYYGLPVTGEIGENERCALGVNRGGYH